jgi:hypothetical protein
MENGYVTSHPKSKSVDCTRLRIFLLGIKVRIANVEVSEMKDMKELMWFLHYEYILCALFSKHTTNSENEKPEADGLYYLPPYSLVLLKTE